MTVEKLHDALNLLPPDLITATDRLRAEPRSKTVPWKRILPMAACFALLMGIGIFWAGKMLPEHIVMQAAAPESQKLAADEAAPEAPADEPMQAAPAEDAAAPQLPSDVGAEEIPYGEASGSVSSMEEELFVDHSHSFAEESDRTVNSHAYCGNMEVTVTIDTTAYSLTGSDAVMLTDILVWLDYDPNTVCRCMAEFTVDAETLSGIQVNMTEAFARCERGQAALTQAQVQAIRTVIEKLS